MKKEYIGLILLIAFILINYNSNFDEFLEDFLTEQENYHIERIIDGDTVVSNGKSIRLLGINTPEKGEEYYFEAKKYLESLILNKSVEIKYGKQKTDKYRRILGYLYFNNTNINQKLVELGFANIYFPKDKDIYFDDFLESWKSCVENRKKNLCEKSLDKCSNCIKLIELDYKKEEVILKNICGVKCELTNWSIKDEGRKKFIFPEYIIEPNSEIKIIVKNLENTEEILYWKNENYVWTDSGDSLFLRDSKNKLVLWKNY